MNDFPDLKDAHNKLDNAVDKLYRKISFYTEQERIEFLLEQYQNLVEKNKKGKQKE